MSYSFWLAARILWYQYTKEKDNTTTFVTPVVEYWLERKMAQWVHHEGSIWRPIAPWADTLLRSYISLQLLYYGATSRYSYSTTELHLATATLLRSYISLQLLYYGATSRYSYSTTELHLATATLLRSYISLQLLYYGATSRYSYSTTELHLATATLLRSYISLQLLYYGATSRYSYSTTELHLATATLLRSYISLQLLYYGATSRSCKWKTLQLMSTPQCGIGCRHWLQTTSVHFKLKKYSRVHCNSSNVLQIKLKWILYTKCFLFIISLYLVFLSCQNYTKYVFFNNIFVLCSLVVQILVVILLLNVIFFGLWNYWKMNSSSVLRTWR